jgi:hypothetical protein
MEDISMVRGASAVKSSDSLADYKAKKAEEEAKAAEAKREAEAKQQQTIEENERVARGKQQVLNEQKRLLSLKEQQMQEQTRLTLTKQEPAEQARLSQLKRKQEMMRGNMRLTKQQVEGAESQLEEARFKSVSGASSTPSLASLLEGLSDLGELFNRRRDSVRNNNDEGGDEPDCPGCAFNSPAEESVDQIQRETVRFESPEITA